MVEILCPCGKTFQAHPSAKRKFCRRECPSIGQLKILSLNSWEEVYCPCGIIFSALKSEKRKYHNRKCAAQVVTSNPLYKQKQVEKAYIRWGTFQELLAGRKFGRLCVRRFAGLSSDCGRVKTVKEANLRVSNSCGRCTQAEALLRDLTGIRFNRLVAIELAKDKNVIGERFWKFKCDCGNVAELQGGSVVTGNTKSCGCLLKEWNILPKSTQTKAKMSRSQKEMPPEKREKQRQSVLVSILSGKYSPHENRFKTKAKIQTMKGGTICYQSSWEVIFAKYLDNNSLVIKFEKDKVRLPYFYNNKNRIYIVDFLVTYEDGKKELVEIKPAGLVNKEENPAKFEVAQKWCEQRSIDFVVITEDEINLIR
jgi:hypothetical protein